MAACNAGTSHHKALVLVYVIVADTLNHSARVLLKVSCHCSSFYSHRDTFIPFRISNTKIPVHLRSVISLALYWACELYLYARIKYKPHGYDSN
jgi:hypothetical protein